MTGRRVFSWVLGTVGSIVALLLVIWLVSSILSRTTLNADPKGREVAAETAFGNLKCRKTLSATFPFFVLKCQDTSERPAGGGSSPPSKP